MDGATAGTGLDPYYIRKYFEPLRVVDVADALDGIGYFNIGLVSPDIRPLWLGMKFWGPAVTQRCVPANKPMWKLETTEDIVNAHGIWFEKYGHKGRGLNDLVKPGSVVVTDVGSTAEVGFFGSENVLGLQAAGAVGIVTNGYCRDTAEVTMQQTPMACMARGRTIIPGRIEVVEINTDDRHWRCTGPARRHRRLRRRRAHSRSHRGCEGSRAAREGGADRRHEGSWPPLREAQPATRRVGRYRRRRPLLRRIGLRGVGSALPP